MFAEVVYILVFGLRRGWLVFWGRLAKCNVRPEAAEMGELNNQTRA